MALDAATQEALVRAWRAQPTRGARDRYYHEAILPHLLPAFRARPAAGAPRSLKKPRALVALVHRAWQPAVLLAAWLRPERLLLLRTGEPEPAYPSGPSVTELVALAAGLSVDHVEQQRIAAEGERAISDELREFIARGGQAPEAVAVDVTGGGLRFSVAAALAGFVAGTRLFLVDWERWDAEAGAPVPFTEFPRLLTDPRSTFSRPTVDRIASDFDAARFGEAAARASALAEQVREPAEAECLERLARGYGAWHAFRFDEARAHLSKLRAALDARSHSPWSWVETVRDKLDLHLDLLAALEEAGRRRPNRLEAGLPLVLNHLAAAERALDLEDLDDAVELYYAAVERAVELLLWVRFHLDDREPDFGARDLDPDRFDAVGRLVFERYVPGPPRGPILFRNGIQLLHTLAPECLTQRDIGPLKGLGRMRNELVHGLVPRHPPAKEVASVFSKVRPFFERLAGGREALRSALDAYAFPRLSPSGTSARGA